MSDRTAALIEALPYIQRLAGRAVVVKYGGAAMAAADLAEAVAADMALLHSLGVRLVVVHGGGPEISAEMRRAGLVPQFVEGLRVTDARALDITQMVLVGRIAKGIVGLLGRHGVPAVSLSGHDGGLLRARRLEGPVDLGFVGQVEAVEERLLQVLVREGFVPVISPIGVDRAGQSYNINADTVAAGVAAALQAEKLLLLTDVEGVRAQAQNPESVLERLTPAQVRGLLEAKAVQGGMIPKLEASLWALDRGVRRVHVVDGRVPHSLLLEIFTDRGVGTLITAEEPS